LVNIQNPVVTVALNLKSKKLANRAKIGHLVLGMKKLLEFGYSFGRLGEEKYIIDLEQKDERYQANGRDVNVWIVF